MPDKLREDEPNLKHAVTIRNTGSTFYCSKGESLMEAMERAGCKDIFVGCRRGGCGACIVRVIRGSVDIIRPMSREYVSEQQQRGGQVLACCVGPKTDLVIEAG